MEDDALKYAPDAYTVDRERTSRAVAEWNDEARRRAGEDIRVRLEGRTFAGLEKDPNAAFIVGVMQKYFLVLARDSAAAVRLFPFIRDSARHVMGIVSAAEGELNADSREALAILRRLSDEVFEKPEEDGRIRLRFLIYDVWKSYEERDRSYAEWMRLTYGEG